MKSKQIFPVVQLPHDMGTLRTDYRGRYYCRYYVRQSDKCAYVTKQHILTAWEDEAEVAAEQKVFYTKLLMEGATVRTRKKIKAEPMHPVRKKGPKSVKIIKIRTVKVHYVVKDGGQIKSFAPTRKQAEENRRAILKADELRPCAHCGKAPEKIVPKGRRSPTGWTHDEEGCPNRFALTTQYMNYQAKVNLWNKYFHKELFGLEFGDSLVKIKKVMETHSLSIL